MRYIPLLALSVFLFSANPTFAGLETLVIKTTIYCDHCLECETCGGKLEKDMGFEKGIRLVKIDEQAMTITVTYNPKKTSPKKIREKIARYGYDADDVKADPQAYNKLDECCKKKETGTE